MTLRPAAAVLALVLLCACSSEEPLTPEASASASCAEIGDLLQRPALRTADVARLARAEKAAVAAAAADDRWAERAGAVRALRAAATDVVSTAERATSNAEQRTVNDAYRAAVARADAACP